MDMGLFFSFFFISLGVILVVVLYDKKVRAGKSYQSKKDITVTAKLVESYSNLSDNKTHYWAKYEYYYNNKKFYIYADDGKTPSPFRQNYEYMYRNGDFPDTIEVYVDAKTGKHTRDKATNQTIKSNLIVLVILTVIALLIMKK